MVVTYDGSPTVRRAFMMATCHNKAPTTTRTRWGALFVL